MEELREHIQRLERRVRNLIRGLPGDRWERRPFRSDAAPVLIGGCGRSGTTLVSHLINAHPNLCCGEESRLFTTPGVNPSRLGRHYDYPAKQVRQCVRESESKGAFIQSFFNHVAAREGKVRWAEKTPGNVHVLGRIFDYFPNARFIHVIRDGRDVSCSYRTHPKYRMVKGERVPTGINRPIDQCARRWNDYVRAGIRHRDEPWYFELRYEDLIRNPEQVMRGVFDFIDEPWDDRVLEFHAHPGRLALLSHLEMRPIDSTAYGRWRNDLSADDAEIVKRIAGDLLVQLGYTQDLEWVPDAGGSTSRQLNIHAPQEA